MVLQWVSNFWTTHILWKFIIEDDRRKFLDALFGVFNALTKAEHWRPQNDDKMLSFGISPTIIVNGIMIFEESEIELIKNRFSLSSYKVIKVYLTQIP